MKTEGESTRRVKKEKKKEKNDDENRVLASPFKILAIASESRSIPFDSRSLSLSPSFTSCLTETMHSALHRGNALFTAATTTLAIVAVLAALSDWRLSSPPFARLQFTDETPPLVSASLSAWEGLAPPSQTLPVGDRAWPRLDVRADLRPLWHWNVKQAFIWVSAAVTTPTAPRSDAVLFSTVASSREEALLHLHDLRPDYPFALTDLGGPGGFLGAPVNLTVGWQTIPRVGSLRSGSRTFAAEAMPAEFREPPPEVRGDWE